MPSKPKLPPKSTVIFCLILGILFLQAPITEGDFYTDFNLIGMECYSEKQTYEYADSAYESADKIVIEARDKVGKLEIRNILGSPRSAPKNYQALEDAIWELKKAINNRRLASMKLSDAYAGLITCVQGLICMQCKERGNHKEESCETCDATSFYSCKHDCPNIEKCSRDGCYAKLETDIDKAYHKEILCSSCNQTYYLCSPDADSHRPRICTNNDSYYYNGMWYYFYMGQLVQGFRHCNTIYSDCLNSTCDKEVSGNHNDYGAANGSCSICSYINVLSESCSLCNP